MSRFIDFWEGYEIPITDYINEYHGEEDAILKGKFNFLNKNLKFSGKVKFNSDKGVLKSTGDYTITQKPWKDSNYMFSHKAKNGETKLDGHFWLAERSNLNFHLYTKSYLTQTENGSHSDTVLQVRTIHPNWILSVGLENFNLLSLIPKDVRSKTTEKSECSDCLPNLSFWSLGGAQVDKNLALWGGLGLSFNLNHKKVDYARLLGTGFHSGKNIKGSIEGTITRHEANAETRWVPSARVFFDVQASTRNRMLGSVEYDHGYQNCNWNLTNDFKVDSATRLKVRLNQNFTLSTALIHTFGFVKFALNANINYVPKAREGHGHLSNKFGICLEFIDA